MKAVSAALDGVYGASLPPQYDVVVEISLSHNFFRTIVTLDDRQRSYIWDLGDLVSSQVSPRERVYSMLGHIKEDLQHGR